MSGVKSFEQLAEDAYTAFVKEDQKSQPVVSGPQLLSWCELRTAERACWIAAAKQLWAEFALVH